MCCVTLFCNVLRASDTSIVVLGFVTHSTIREELQSCLVMYVYCVRGKENLRFDFLIHSTCFPSDPIDLEGDAPYGLETST
jgi:hypothetical protein